MQKGWKYRTKWVKKGVSKNGNPWVSFSVSEKVTDNSGSSMWANWRIMAMQDLDVREEDDIEIVSIDSISSSIYKGKLQHTLWCEINLIIPEPEYAETDDGFEGNSIEPDKEDEDRLPFDL